MRKLDLWKSWCRSPEHFSFGSETFFFYKRKNCIIYIVGNYDVNFQWIIVENNSMHFSWQNWNYGRCAEIYFLIFFFFFQNIKLRTLGSHECLTSCQNWKYNNKFFLRKPPGGGGLEKKLRNRRWKFLQTYRNHPPTIFFPDMHIFSNTFWTPTPIFTVTYIFSTIFQTSTSIFLQMS